MLPSPKSMTDLQRVLGIITYMALSILHLSDLTSPTISTKKKKNNQSTSGLKVTRSNQSPDL